MTERHATLFRSGPDQALRIPREFELEGSEVVVRKEGQQLIITPVRKSRLMALLASWTPLDEAALEVDDLPVQQRPEL